MKTIDEYLEDLINLLQLLVKVPNITNEDGYWKILHLISRINWIRVELGQEPLKFIRGTYTIDK